MKMESVRLRKIITWRHTCGSTNIKKRFRKTKDPRVMKDVLTGELHDTYTEEYRDGMLDKVCLDCKCSGYLTAFYNPLYRTRMECIGCGKKTDHEYDMLNDRDRSLVMTCLDCGAKERIHMMGSTDSTYRFRE